MVSGVETIHHSRLFLGVDAYDPQMHLRPVAVLSKMQELGTGQCEILGYGESWMEAEGIFWVMVRMQLELSPYYGVGFCQGETWSKGARGAVWRRDYYLSTTDNKVIARGIAIWALLDRNSRLVLRPDRFPRDFPVETDRNAMEKVPVKLAWEEELPILSQYKVSYRDLDSNGHAHNGRYAEWICEAVPRILLREKCITSLQIDFRQEALEGDCVVIAGKPFADDPDRWQLEARVKEKPCFLAELRF